VNWPLPIEYTVGNCTDDYRANDKDYSHEGVGFSFKKWQADTVMKYMDSEEVKYFEKDKGAAKEPVKKYGTGDEKGDAPKQSF
jgi:hypothetical protein